MLSYTFQIFQGQVEVERGGVLKHFSVSQEGFSEGPPKSVDFDTINQLGLHMETTAMRDSPSIFKLGSQVRVHRERRVVPLGKGVASPSVVQHGYISI